jgi:hypothetical protein
VFTGRTGPGAAAGVRCALGPVTVTVGCAEYSNSPSDSGAALRCQWSGRGGARAVSLTNAW